MKTKILLIVFITIVISALEILIWDYVEVYNKVISLILCTVTLSVFITSILLFNNNVKPIFRESIEKDRINKEDFERICNVRELWKVTATLCNFIHIILICLPIFCSIVIVFINTFGSEPTYQSNIFYSILSITLTILDLILKPQEISSDNRKAFVDLNYHVLRYDNNLISASELIDSVNRGENFISNSMP